MADHLGIPRDRVYGVATPTVKAQIVTDLRQDFDQVVMVGDGINDLCAMQIADVAILTIQQAGDRPEALYKEADHVVKSVSGVIPIVKKLLSAPRISDRDACDASYKR
jgi:soluble P-type ATPase